MSSGIYVALAGARVQNDALDVAANNIANINTAGYKALRASFGEVVSRAKSPDYVQPGVSDVRVDNSAGPIVETGNPLDLALVGEGYFAVESPAGTRYTRAGEFGIAADGTMVTKAGLPVLAVGGKTITIPPAVADVFVDAGGVVYADDLEVGAIQLATFAPESMTPEGNSLFIASGQPLKGSEMPEVVSGAVEGSNANAMRGVIDMVRISRSYEALMRIIEGFKAIDSRTAREIGSAR